MLEKIYKLECSSTFCLKKLIFNSFFIAKSVNSKPFKSSWWISLSNLFKSFVLIEGLIPVILKYSFVWYEISWFIATSCKVDYVNSLLSSPTNNDMTLWFNYLPVATIWFIKSRHKILI